MRDNIRGRVLSFEVEDYYSGSWITIRGRGLLFKVVDYYSRLRNIIQVSINHSNRGNKRDVTREVDEVVWCTIAH